MSLEEIRKEIDLLDDQIISLLEKRFKKVHQLQVFKPSITDLQREQSILSKIPSPLIHEVYKTIFLCSKKLFLQSLHPHAAIAIFPPSLLSALATANPNRP